MSLVAAVATLLAGWAAPAQADGPILLPEELEPFIIVGGQVDFGDGNLTIWGLPSRNGHMWWMYDALQPSVSWPRLDGRLFINNAAGLCARVQMVYHDHANNALATRNGGTVCSPDNRRNAWEVDLMPYGSASIDHVHVNLQTVGPNGFATTIGSSVRFRP